MRRRHSSAWKGEVQVHDDGWIRMKRQPVQIKARSEESIMLSNPIIDVTDEGVGDMAKMAPDLVQPT